MIDDGGKLIAEEHLQLGLGTSGTNIIHFTLSNNRDSGQKLKGKKKGLTVIPGLF